MIIPGIVAAGFRLTGGDPPPAGEAHRYWRLDWGAPFNNNVYMRLGELELRAVSGGPSLPLTAGGTASANSQYYPATRAFDGKLTANSKDFVGATQTGWLQWDFGVGNAQEIVEALVQNTSTTNGAEEDQHIRNFTLSYSDDGSAWTLVAKKFNHPKAASASTVLSTTTPITSPGHRYWRLYITANSGGSIYTALSDLEFMEDGYDVTSGIANNASANSTTHGPASAAFDASTTSWVTGENQLPAWIAIDLKIQANINSLSITPQPGSPERTPKDFDLQWSDNGTDWTTAASYTGETGWTNSEKRTFTV